jgi:hypothetical protein
MQAKCSIKGNLYKIKETEKKRKFGFTFLKQVIIGLFPAKSDIDRSFHYSTFKINTDSETCSKALRTKEEML